MPRTTSSFHFFVGLHRWSSAAWHGSEHLAEEVRLSSALLAEKWEKPYSQVFDYVNARTVGGALPSSEPLTSAREALE
jgi:hypothetical protein